MRIAVFGANGNVGRQLVADALASGLSVTAFVHSTDPFAAHTELTVVQGDVADAGAVCDALQDVNAVVSTLGTFGRKRGGVLAPATHTIVHEMQALNLRRVVTLTGGAAVESGRGLQLRGRTNRLILQLMDRPAVRDSETHLRLLRASGLDWTTVLAPKISDDGDPRFRLDRATPVLTAAVSRAAVSAALMDLATTDSYLASTIGIHPPER